VFATVEVGSDETDLHAALCLSFNKTKQGPRLAQELSGDGVQSSGEWENKDIEAVSRTLDVFLDKTVNLFIKGLFSVDRDALAADSLVASMIGLRTKAGEEQFLLSGAQFAVRGFPDDTISWYLKPGSYGHKVAGEVTRSWVENLHPESISDAVHVIEARFSRIVRAHSNIGSHVSA
jgi:hypothetical protein